MKPFVKWRTAYGMLEGIMAAAALLLVVRKQFFAAAVLLVFFAAGAVIFSGLWTAFKKKGSQVELDISRVLGKDAKDALVFGDVGILTYNDEFICTWASDFFKDRDIDITNKKLTAWIGSIRNLVDEEVDMVTGESEGKIYEIVRRPNSQSLYVRDITRYTRLEQKYKDSRVVVGLLQLDNYMEYQSYENEDIMASINTGLRSLMTGWAKENDMFFRRIRSDRILVLCSEQILKDVRAKNLPILQEVKDKAREMDVNITLSMAFAYGTRDFPELDNMLNELIELAQSRGGDQCAIQKYGHKVQFIGGNSETGTQRNKVRVRVMAQTLQDAIRNSGDIYIAGHTATDYDCMGAALAVSNWVTAMGKKAYIVLKDVPRDPQLQESMNHYANALAERHTFITPEAARSRMDKDNDLLIMVDHNIPAISSARDFIDEVDKIAVIDHHRKNDQFVDHAMVTYVESKSSSTCELVTELLQNIPSTVPIFEAEATIMYLGLLIDTNRFKMHTSARTFDTASVLRQWGASVQDVEEALQEDYESFREKAKLISEARPYLECMISVSETPVNRTLMSQVSDDLLKIKGVEAAFTIAPDIADPSRTCISARSIGNWNVQRIMEQMGGGGHFSAAACQRRDITPQALAQELKEKIKEDKNHESDPA